jgi:diaminopimelate decarboxylase
LVPNYSVSPFVDALGRVREYLDRVLVGSLQKEGARIRYLDLGGGLGISYKDEMPPHPEEYAQAIIQGVQGLDVTLILEPGRVIVGNAGILLTEVQYLKETDEKKFVIVDGGMNDLIRPALYGSYQAIQPVVQKSGEKIVADIVGPIAGKGLLAKDREDCAAGAVIYGGDERAPTGLPWRRTKIPIPKPPEILVDGTSTM